MGKSKSKKSEVKAADNTQVEARPVGEGKDPLAEGNTLVNPTNSEAETHYDVKERSEDVRTSEIAGQNANERAEEHNAQAVNTPSDVPNSDTEEQDEVAAGRVEPGDEDPTPEPDTTDDSEEEVTPPADDSTPSEEDLEV